MSSQQSWVRKEQLKQSFTDVFKIGVLENFAILTGKHMCWGLFNKVAGLKARCLPVNTVKFLRTLFSENTSGRLLLLFYGFIHMYENLESLQGPGSWTATPWVTPGNWFENLKGRKTESVIMELTSGFEFGILRLVIQQPNLSDHHQQN